jgi:predicted RNA binding protein YcfA (HicA-like mRNA interferase family)
MPHFGPISRKDFIYYLRKDGFTGPFAGGKHQFMMKGRVSLILPNPHLSDIGKAFLAKLLRQAGIEKSHWEKL